MIYITNNLYNNSRDTDQSPVVGPVIIYPDLLFGALQVTGCHRIWSPCYLDPYYLLELVRQLVSQSVS